MSNENSQVSSKKDKKENWTVKQEMRSWLQAFAFALAIIGALYLLGFKIKSVDGVSMSPTLATGDRLVTSNFNYKPKTGDVVVFFHDSKNSSQRGDFVKRVVATQGQSVDINFHTGEVKVDGKVVLQEYSTGKLSPSARGDYKYPLSVPEGHIFVLGDNREDSLDSRFSQVGMVPTSTIKGKAIFRFFPFNKIGEVK